jgi:hypothetical protein
VASSEAPGDLPILAVDGDPGTVWRGDAHETRWQWTLPFRRPLHLGLIRAWFGDTAASGVPACYRWEVQLASGERCEPNAPWSTVPNGVQDDRHPNEFVHGPKTVHAQRQVLFTDIDACAIRLFVEAMDGNVAPVLREVEVYSSARSVTQELGVQVKAEGSHPALPRSTTSGVVDGKYETFWAGDPGAGPWSMELRLPSQRLVDRIWLLLGYDAVTVERPGMTGLRYTGSHLPLSYSIEVTDGLEPVRWDRIDEAEAPMFQGEPLPVRRRMIRLNAARRVQALRLLITKATGFWGESDLATAPVVREIGLYEASDTSPAIHEPLMLSVSANPSALAHKAKYGEAYVDGGFARNAYARLRRFVVGFDADTRWPADASRTRDDGTGRFLEVIEGDDPTLDRALLVESSPPPLVMFSGGLNWEFGSATAPAQHGAWAWNVIAPASSPDRGMGQLADEVADRVAPFLGFCGGAQILGVLEAIGSATATDDERPRDVYDSLILRNTNEPIVGIAHDKKLIELGWWYDGPELDASRPVIFFDERDALFETMAGLGGRSSSRAFPSSHYDMLRLAAFSTRLSTLRVSAWSDYCRPFVKAAGPEPVFADPHAPGSRCVRIPQAFRSRDRDRFPVVGFQFHPEQRDFPRLAPGATDDERGDAINVFANAVDLAVDGWLRVTWPNQ